MLDYTVTYRGMDKKPYDNILKEPAVTQLVKQSFNILGGDSITNEFEKTASIHSSLATAATSTLATAAISPLAAASASAFDKIASAFLVEPAGLGKVLCPSAR